MNNKKRNFLIFNLFLVLLILSINNLFLYYFNNLTILFLLNILIFTLLYYLLSNTLIDEMFQINNKLSEKIKKTMHELNTPVSTISINTQIIRQKTIDEKTLKRLDRIEDCCEQLIKLYNDMEYSIKKEIERIDIKEFCLKNAINDSAMRFEDIKGNIIINNNIKNLNIKCDYEGFLLTIQNLISNSIKHNTNITKIDFNIEKNILMISDDGEGIIIEDIYNVFEKFVQGDNTKAGFGLGLNIVKEYCDKNKIDIKLKSNTNGTTFYLNLTKVIS